MGSARLPVVLLYPVAAGGGPRSLRLVCGCFHSVWGGRARGCPAPELEDSPTAGGGGWRQGGGGGPTRRPPGPLARRRRRPLPARPPRGQRRCTHEAAWRVPHPWTCRQVERRAPVTRVGVARQTASPSGASPGARARAHLLSDHRPQANRTLARLATGWCPQCPLSPPRPCPMARREPFSSSLPSLGFASSSGGDLLAWMRQALPLRGGGQSL